jgi:lipopolysaccharide/colanic/teichoic acid biosynthesis glycosyltransferase
MYTISKPDVHFKIVPEESVFIIGSNSKDEPGDFYTLEINLALNTPKQLRKKRVFDVVVSVLLIPMTPVLLIVVGNKTDFILNIFKVLLGEKTWVGYAPVSNMELLPKIKPSVLATTGKASHVSHNEVAIQKINFLYAKEYSIEKDLGIVIRSLKQLGN